jgi:hypothetical protein
MTDKTAFTDEEWKVVAEGPTTAGMILVTADSGGSFRETWALSKALAEARAHHGQNELLDSIVAEKPGFDRGGAHTGEELKSLGLERLQQAAGLLEQKATAQELDDYRAFVVNVATKVAQAHKEHGQEVSPPEQGALDEISSALGSNQS